MVVSSALDPPSSPTLTSSMTPVASGTMPLNGAATCTASDSPVSQTCRGSSLAGDLVSAGGDSAESGSANAASEAAAGVSDGQSAAAEGPIGDFINPKSRATALAEEIPMDGAASSQHAQGIPTPSMAGSRSVEGVPSVDAVSSPAAQGIPNAEVTGALPGTDMPCPHANSPPARIISMPETSGAVPAEGIPGRIAVTLPVFGVAREQNGRAYMEDRADVLQLQLPHDEEAHMLAVYDGHNGNRAAHRTMLNMDSHLMRALHNGNTVLAALATAFDDAERELFRHHQQVVAKPEWFGPEGPRGGTTALVAVLHHNHLYLANVGDCRAVLGRMEAVVGTQNHKPNLEQQRGAARLAQEQLYWEEGVAYLPTQPHDGQQVQRLALSRALGDFDLTGSTDNITVVMAQLRDSSKAQASQEVRPQHLQFSTSKSQGARH
ncbi:TPA: hypothetical protein ACH3X3_009656 [Trebouxia sp. C0006]